MRKPDFLGALGVLAVNVGSFLPDRIERFAWDLSLAVKVVFGRCTERGCCVSQQSHSFIAARRRDYVQACRLSVSLNHTGHGWDARFSKENLEID